MPTTADVSVTTTTIDVPWPKASIVILPGIPGFDGNDDGSRMGPNLFPSRTTDVYKVLRQEGYDVEYSVPREERQLIALYADDVWLPYLAFAGTVGIPIILGVVANLITEFVRNPKATLNLKFAVQDEGGRSARVFEASGNSDEVRAAMADFLEVTDCSDG